MSGCDREQGTHYQCECMQERMQGLEKENAELRKELAQKDAEIQDQDREIAEAREMVAQEWRQWATGGKAWKLEQENAELWEKVERMQGALEHLRLELREDIMAWAGVDHFKRIYLRQLSDVAHDALSQANAQATLGGARGRSEEGGQE